MLKETEPLIWGPFKQNIFWEPEEVTASLTAQPEADGMEDPIVVIAAVVALCRLVHMIEDQSPVWCHFVPRQHGAVVVAPLHRDPGRDHVVFQLLCWDISTCNCVLF